MLTQSPGQGGVDSQYRDPYGARQHVHLGQKLRDVFRTCAGSVLTHNRKGADTKGQFSIAYKQKKKTVSQNGNEL